MLFRITVDSKSLFRYDDNGLIFGNICCQIDDVFFPDEFWSDFIVVILGWWVDSLTKLMTSSNQEDFSFMDGPFAFHIKLKGDNLCDIKCRNKFTKENYTCEIFFDSFAQQVIEAAQKVIDKCKMENWKSDDLIILIYNHVHLCKVAKSLI